MRTKFRVIITLFLAFIVQLTFAQQKTVSGTVVDGDGLPIPGVNVIIKGTTTGTQTDFDGNFTLQVSSSDVLVFDYVGMKKIELPVGQKSTFNVSMEANVEALKEVVVVAYGTQKKEAIVGSVTTVGSDIIEQQQVSSPLRALQGTVAGVNMITSGGQPGTNPSFVIRGFGSFNGDNQPLIILDGAQFNGNLNTISQDQIESMTVLKDASAASLYGSRAANGVVIITTKRGKQNSKATVSIRSQYGFSDFAVGIHDLVNKEDYLRLGWQALRNDAFYNEGLDAQTAAQNASSGIIPYVGYNPFSFANPIDENGNLVSGANLLWDDEWENLVLRENVPRINHNINITGGGENNNYFLSLDYLNEEGPVITSDFERIAARAGIDSKVNDWFKTGMTVSYSRSFSRNPDQTSGSTTQAISWIYNVNSIYPLFARGEDGSLLLDDNGDPFFDLFNGNDSTGSGVRPAQSVNYNRPGITGENIIAALTLGAEDRIRTNFLGSAYAEISFLKKFNFKSTFNYENFVFDSHSFDDDQFGAASNVNGRVSKTRNVTTTLNAIQALNYTDKFAEVHNLSVDVIHEAYTNTTNTFSSSVTGFLPDVEEIGLGTTPESFGGFRLEQRLSAWLGRLSYNYDNKYFVEGSFRQDNISSFLEDNRTGEFFSFGGSWILSKESFLEDVLWINNLKLRGSYGQVGNIAIPGGFFPVSAGFVANNFGGVNISPVEGNPSLLPQSPLPDPNLTWESTNITNLGLDFTVFDGVFSGTVEYFINESEDLIQNITTAPSSGVPVVRANAGSIRNSGIEFTFNANVINKDDIQWSVGGNFSVLSNEINEISPFTDQLIQGTKFWAPGNSLFEFYLREWAGVNPANGDAQWELYYDDLDGNGIFNDGEEILSLSQYRNDNPEANIRQTVTNRYDIATRLETGKESLPDFNGGFNTFFRYKQFDIAALFNFSVGGYLLDTDYSGLINNFNSPGNSAHPDNFNAWQQPGDITDFPRLTTANNFANNQSTRFLFRNDFLRLKSLTVGYNLPKNLLDKVGLSSMRIYFQGDNLVTWQSHGGIDPEQAFNGLTNNRSPLLRTYTFGTLIQF